MMIRTWVLKKVALDNTGQFYSIITHANQGLCFLHKNKGSRLDAA